MTGMAFLVACTCHNKLTKAERNHLKQERDSIIAEISNKSSLDMPKDDPLYYLLKKREWEYAQWQRIYEIDTLLKDEQASDMSKSNLKFLEHHIQELKEQVFMTVYGPPQ